MLLIVVALVIWWLVSEANEPEAAPVSPTGEPVFSEATPFADDAPEAVDLDVMPAEPITTVAALVDIANRPGTPVDIERVRVDSLAGDMAFYVGEGDSRALVVFDETRTPDSPMEGAVDVNEGELVGIEGEVYAADRPLPSGVQANLPAGTEYYVFARTIEPVE